MAVLVMDEFKNGRRVYVDFIKPRSGLLLFVILLSCL